VSVPAPHLDIGRHPVGSAGGQHDAGDRDSSSRQMSFHSLAPHLRSDAIGDSGFCTGLRHLSSIRF
jgi:hypothetical protein